MLQFDKLGYLKPYDIIQPELEARSFIFYKIM
jgi:hypothetical protein